MLIGKRKNSFKILCGTAALLILIFSVDITNASRGGRGGNGRSGSFGRTSAGAFSRGDGEFRSGGNFQESREFRSDGMRSHSEFRSFPAGPRFSGREFRSGSMNMRFDGRGGGRDGSGSMRREFARGDERSRGNRFESRMSSGSGRGGSERDFRSSSGRGRGERDFSSGSGRGDERRFDTDLSRGRTSFRVVDRIDLRERFFDNRHFIDRRHFFVPHNDFVFFGSHRFLHHRIIHPDFFFLTFFTFGHHHIFHPIFPFHHVRFIFVNPFGFWPYDYNYYRYYQYGCYPYQWYGYNPVPYQYGSDTYNYYTYNYYGSDAKGPLSEQELNSMRDYKAQPPQPSTSVDEYFDAGVKAFEGGDYNTAIAKFALAREQAPDDKVLVFAYSQAYLSAGDYKSSAQVLRAALAKVTNPLTEGVFYPRGLYESDDVLLKQIDVLAEKANQNKQDTDLQLLLGYQYLGLGELDRAWEPLNIAGADSMNGSSAKTLLQMLDKLQTEQKQQPKVTETPGEVKQ